MCHCVSFGQSFRVTMDWGSIICQSGVHLRRNSHWENYPCIHISGKYHHGRLEIGNSFPIMPTKLISNSSFKLEL